MAPTCVDAFNLPGKWQNIPWNHGTPSMCKIFLGTMGLPVCAKFSVNEIGIKANFLRKLQIWNLFQNTISRNATDHHPGTIYNIFKIS